MKRAVFCNRWLPYLLLLPQMVVVVAFFFWPAFDSLRLALFQASPFGDRLKFVGLQNFTPLLTSPAYHESALNSLVFACGVTFGGLAMALGLAVLATQKTRGLVFNRTALLWPYGIAPAVAGIIWLFIFHPTYGIVPYLLSCITAYTFNCPRHWQRQRSLMWKTMHCSCRRVVHCVRPSTAPCCTLSTVPAGKPR